MSYSCIKPVVLLVEDNLLLLLDARMALEDEGYTVIEAVDAQDALAQLRDRDDIVAIISDVVMPGPIDGLALATIMRARRPDLPIVLTSGSSGIGVPPPGCRSSPSRIVPAISPGIWRWRAIPCQSSRNASARANTASNISGVSRLVFVL